jgi:Arc/MetJ family transcription regulator
MSLGRSLTCMHIWCILIHMRTTLNINDDLLRRAADLTGVKEKTSLVHLGLEALIARETARRLAALGGTEKTLRPIRRRRSGTAS